MLVWLEAFIEALRMWLISRSTLQKKQRVGEEIKKNMIAW
jgi:hypothetical protein